jgi:integrase
VGRPRRARVKLPPHVHAVKAKGKEYFYYQPYRGSEREATRVKLPGAPFDLDGTPSAAWWDAYRVLSGEKETGPRSGSFAALLAVYQESPEWRELSARTQVLWRPLLGRVEQAWATLAVRGLEARHVLALRDAYADTPGMANNLIRALSSVLAWSVPRGWRDTNPCLGLRKLKGGEGYAPWSWEEIEFFRATARRDIWHAAALALYSGQRLNDVLRMRWSDIKGGLIAVVQQKTGKQLWIPAHADLSHVLAEMPRTHVHILTNSRGAAWTLDGFKTSWGDELDRPEFSALREGRRVFHGLRKSAVVFLLEAGCTDAEVSAITGQSRRMVEHYSRQVSQKKLAAAAVLKWEAAGAPRTDPERNL